MHAEGWWWWWWWWGYMSENQVSGQEKKGGQVERDPVVGFGKKMAQ